jgi:hypothetical protein
MPAPPRALKCFESLSPPTRLLGRARQADGRPPNPSRYTVQPFRPFHLPISHSLNEFVSPEAGRLHRLLRSRVITLLLVQHGNPLAAPLICALMISGDCELSTTTVTPVSCITSNFPGFQRISNGALPTKAIAAAIQIAVSISTIVKTRDPISLRAPRCCLACPFGTLSLLAPPFEIRLVPPRERRPEGQQQEHNKERDQDHHARPYEPSQ